MKLDWDMIWKEVDDFQANVKNLNELDYEDVEVLKDLRRRKIEEIVNREIASQADSKGK